MKHFRLHVCALPHTQTNKKYCPCAYTMKVYNFCKMMKSLGHEVYHYGAEGSTPDCTEHIQVISNEEQRLLYGNHPIEVMFPIKWDSSLPIWALPNSRTIVEILKRKTPHDLVCLIGGNCQKPIADAVGTDVMAVEFGIGYEGVFAKYKVFESYTHMACVIGMMKKQNDVGNYDVVIPNYYDVDDFPYHPKKEDYYVYIGRMTKLKGVEIAVQATRAAGVKLLIAGQGVKHHERGKIVTDDFTITDPHVEYVGTLGVERRAEIVGKAKAVLMPTRYHEPFGGVAAEAQLYGTPVISSDWAAFAETVEHGKTGFRCRTLRHFVDAINNVEHLDPQYIRNRAVDLWSMDRVKWLYQEYFTMLSDLWIPAGWNRLDGESDPDWLCPLSYRGMN